MPEHKPTDENKNVYVRRLFLTAAVVIFAACCIIVFWFAVERYQGLSEGWSTFVGVWQSIIIGFAFAFLMNPIMEFFEKRMLPFFQRHCKTDEGARKLTRRITSIMALIILVGAIVLFFVAVIPELYSTFYYLLTHLSEQIDGVLDWANEITGGKYEKNIMSAKGSDIDAAIDNGIAWVQNYVDVSTNELVSMVASGALSVGKFLADVIIGFFVSVYALCSKETFKGQAKKLIYGIFRTDIANAILDIGRKTRDIFYGFIIGEILDSILVGFVCYVFMLIFKMPYPVLISSIIGVTNIIPVFGPYLGAVPATIIIFLTNPMQGIYFIILILVLQQIDGNFIAPKILGDSTGISSFWVLVAIVVGGGLFGFAGMIFGVPTMGLIYYLVGRWSRKRLRKKELPEGTSAYINLERVDEEANIIVEHTAEYNENTHINIFPNRKKKKNPVDTGEGSSETEDE